MVEEVVSSTLHVALTESGQFEAGDVLYDVFVVIVPVAQPKRKK